LVEFNEVDDLEGRSVVVNQHVGEEIDGVNVVSLTTHRRGDIAVERKGNGLGGRRSLDDMAIAIHSDIDFESLVPKGVMPKHDVAEQGFADEDAITPTQNVRWHTRKHPDVRLVRVEVEVSNHVTIAHRLLQASRRGSPMS
jgi:hypothetical protein